MIHRLGFVFFAIWMLSIVLGAASACHTKPDEVKSKSEAFPASIPRTEQGLVAKDPTKWTTVLQPDQNLAVGSIVTITMRTAVPEGFWLYAAKKSLKDGPLPTTFELDKETVGIELIGGVIDVGTFKTEYDDIFETDVYKFLKQATFSQQFKITKANARIAGALRYQFCTEAGCNYGNHDVDLKPDVKGTEKSIDEKAAIKSDSAKADSLTNVANDTLPTQVAEQSTKSEQSTAIAAGTDASGPKGEAWWLTFIKAFLGGLVTLVTPCVFPMIPMTVSYFTKKSVKRSVGIRNAFTYALSIVFIFVVLGLLITSWFDETALYNFSINSTVNFVLFLIIFLFGLSFLGLFEITLPSSWVTKVDQQSDKQSGILGIFFMALTLVLASFSCVGPIAGPILIEASKGSVWGPLIGMTAYSLGFAIPFGLFALFPGWLHSLPRSGGWLNNIKASLGFIELALCLKFLSQADLREQWGLLDREVFLALWIVIFTLLGFYILGKMRLSHDTPVEKISVIRVIFAIASFTFVLYLIPGLWGAQLPRLSGLLPPTNDHTGVRVAAMFATSNSTGANADGVCGLTRKYADKLGPKAPHGFCMFYDLDEGLAYAKSVNKPVFIDFTGHTCANCREMESKVWPLPEVKNILTKDYVMISLYVDDKTPLDSTIKLPNGKKLRTVGDKWQHLQVERFAQFSQPYYVVVDHQMKPLTNEGKPYTPDVKEYVDFLKSGIVAFKPLADIK
jgi:thiol:disulfide interchange protein